MAKLKIALYRSALFGMSLGLICLQGGIGTVRSDEGGVSFWLPGQYGSFAAVPMDQGWSLPLVYHHAKRLIGKKHHE